MRGNKTGMASLVALFFNFCSSLQLVGLKKYWGHVGLWLCLSVSEFNLPSQDGDVLLVKKTQLDLIQFYKVD